MDTAAGPGFRPFLLSITLDIRTVYSPMPFKAPLTHADLRSIRARQPWNPDLIALLWEVKRLRSVLLRAYQLSGDFKRPAGITGDLYDDFMKALRDEPCVIERDQDVQEMMETPNKLRKGMAPR